MAHSLLYGPRPLGPGPQARPLALNGATFATLKQCLIDGQLPDWIRSTCPEINIDGPADDDDSWAGLTDGESHTSASLLGITDRNLNLSMVRDCGQEIISLDYDVYEKGTLPGNDIERRLFRALAETLPEEIIVEMTAYNQDELHAILDAYPDQLSLAISVFGQSCDEATAIQSIARESGLDKEAAKNISSVRSLSDLLDFKDGRSWLEAAVAIDMLTFRRPLSAFA